MAEKKDLKAIAAVLRRDSIKMTASAGSGHPTSCMSCAEIMASLFFSEMKFDAKDPLNPDNDEFVLSKGHAAPILYSCLFHAGAIKENLLSLRKIDSPLEGHPMPNSLKNIKVATGSLGQGLSVGCGMALASKKQGRKFRVFVLMGDSEIAEGSVYEALQFAHHYNLNNLVAIVDANRLGQRGETMEGHNLRPYEARFNAFGWETIAIDGHNVSEVLAALEKARGSEKPFAIIAKTFKGRGVSFLENKDNWHGKPVPQDKLEAALKEIPDVPFPKVSVQKPEKIPVKKAEASKMKFTDYKLGNAIATRSGYGNALANLVQADSGAIIVDAEVSNSTHSEEVKKFGPKQFVETYIQEQNMIGVALGLSVKGFRPFASTFAAFLSRCHDQIRMAALSSASITVCGSHAGVSIGEDGASQMGLEDIALFRALPNSAVFYPSDAVAAEKIVELCASMPGIKYIRTTRGKTPVLYSASEKFEAGGFKVLKESRVDKVILVGAGITLHESLKASQELEKQNVKAAVIDLYCVKPFDSKKFIAFAKAHGGKIVVSEDHYAEGGIGEMIASELAGSGIEVKRLFVKGIPHSGKPEELVEKYNIGYRAIIKEALK
ncbi:MAG: transketolase [archaeon]